MYPLETPQKVPEPDVMTLLTKSEGLPSKPSGVIQFGELFDKPKPRAPLLVPTHI